MDTENNILLFFASKSYVIHVKKCIALYIKAFYNIANLAFSSLGKISIKGNHKKLDIKKKIVSIVLMT
jgi:hypothetical protein